MITYKTNKFFKRKNTMEEFDIKVTKHQIGTKGAKIAVIGVGGAGGSMLSTIAKSDIGEDVKLVAANK